MGIGNWPGPPEWHHSSRPWGSLWSCESWDSSGETADLWLFRHFNDVVHWLPFWRQTDGQLQGTNGCGASWLSGSVRDLQAGNRWFDPGWPELCSEAVLLDKALCPCTRGLSSPRNEWVPGIGQWRLVCLNSSVRRKWQPGCMLPGNWDGLWMNRSCDQGVIVWGRVSSASR